MVIARAFQMFAPPKPRRYGNDGSLFPPILTELSNAIRLFTDPLAFQIRTYHSKFKIAAGALVSILLKGISDIYSAEAP